jgi:Flp pilus assembly protein TadG
VVLTRPGARRSDDGAVAVFVALIVVLVVIPLLATVVDLGLTRTLSTRFRGAADAAALAAAADLSVNKTST